MSTVTTALADIRHHMDSGIFGSAVNHDDITAVARILSKLNSADSREVIRQLTDAELKQIAAEMNDPAWFNNGGLTQDERNSFFREMARDLDGAGLAKLSKAFESDAKAPIYPLLADDNITGLARAVASHSPPQVKLDFIARLAGQSNDQTRVGEPNGEWRMHDPQARAIAEVIGSLGNDPAAAERAFKLLTPAQLAAVFKAGINQTLWPSMPMESVMPLQRQSATDASTLVKLLQVAARMADPQLKAKVFDAASTQFTALLNGGHTKDAEAVRSAMGKLLLSDTNGVMRYLAVGQNTQDGKALAQFIQASLAVKDTRTLEELQLQISLGNRKNESHAERFNREEVGPDGGKGLINAKVAGYYAGALDAGINRLRLSDTQKGDLANLLLKGVLRAIDKTGISVGPSYLIGTASDLLPLAVKSLIDGSLGEKKAPAEKLRDALMPMTCVGKEQDGTPILVAPSGTPAEAAFSAAWARTRERAAS